MSDSNFLPEYKPHIRTSDVRTLRCLFTGKEIIEKPEEHVRQRVLNWLLKDKNWDRLHMNIEQSYQFTSGKHGRSDIELLDTEGRPILIVECKKRTVEIGNEDILQARRYANKAKAKFVWITNGEQHRFQSKNNSKKWDDCDYVDVLEVFSAAPKVVYALPERLSIRSFDTYMANYPDTALSEWYASCRPKPISKFLKDHYMVALISTLNLIHGDRISSKLPCRLNGIYILEDRGVGFHRFSTPRGSWFGLYRDFLVATENSIAALSVGIQYGSEDSPLRLCVGVVKRIRKHHALQLNFDDCRFDDTNGHFDMWHSGVLGGRSKRISTVLEAVGEAGRDDLIRSYDGRDWVHLGPLHSPTGSNGSIRSNKRFLCNLLHYALIRTELRESSNQWILPCRICYSRN